MISSIMPVGIVAVVAYVLLPRAGYLWFRNGWRRVVNRIRAEKGTAGICTGYIDGKLRIQRTAPDSGEILFASPRHTMFFILRKNEEIERLDWKTVFLLQTGTTLLFMPSKRRFIRGICIFYEEKNNALLSGQLQGLAIPERFSNPVKPYSIACGAFLEFLLFLAYIRKPETEFASQTALAAIFGVAMPYLPPGLVLTLAARIGGKKEAGTKKSRQRKVAGFLLETAGVLLNIGVILFVIGRIGL